jgi:hypothetical protein
MVNSLARDRGSNVRQALTIMEPVRSHGGAYIYNRSNRLVSACPGKERRQRHVIGSQEHRKHAETGTYRSNNVLQLLLASSDKLL